MYSTRKKVRFAIATLAVAALGLGGCSNTPVTSGGAGTPAPTPPESAAAPTGDAPSAAAPNGEGSVAPTSEPAPAGPAVEVTFWQQKFEDYQQKWFKQQVDAFNATQSGVKVKLLVVPGDVWDQKLKAAQAAGTQPDIATTSYGRIAAGVAEGKFATLDDLIPAEKFADIKENLKSFVTIDGKHYAYPMLVEPSTVLYYRTDLAKAAGLDPAAPPKTWDELINWATKLTSAKTKGITIASVAADLGWSSWGLQLNACGHLPISPDWSEAAAADPCYGKLFDLYRTLYQNKLMPQTNKVGYADAAPYGNGEVAMMVNGSWAVGALKAEYPKQLPNTAVAPFPSMDGDASKPTATLGGWTLTVDTKSKNTKAAASFIDWLLAGDPTIMTGFFKASGYSKYTTRTSVDEALASDPDASKDPFMQIISEKVVATGQAEPGYPWDIALAMGKAIESTMKGQVDGPTAGQKANDEIADVIKKQDLAGSGPGA